MQQDLTRIHFQKVATGGQPQIDYVPVAFLKDRLIHLSSQRRNGIDAMVFILFFVFYMALLDVEYLGRVEAYYWAREALTSNFVTQPFHPLAEVRPLREGEVNLYNSPHTFQALYNGEDWHHWLRDIVLGSLFNTSNPNVTDTGGYFFEAGQIKKIGAMRIRAQRILGRCEAGKCDYSYKVSSLDRSDYGPMVWVDCPSFVRVEGDMNYYTCSGNVMDIPFNVTYDEAVSRVLELQTDSFDIVDVTSVRLLTVDMLYYLPSIDSYILASCFAELPLGGAFVTRAPITVLRREASSTTIGLMAACLVILFFIIVMLALRHVQAHWRLMPTSAARPILWWIHIALLISHFTFLGLRLEATPSIPVDGSTDTFPTSVWRAAMFYYVELHFAALSGLCAVIRLLSLFHFFPYLKVVTLTIALAFRNMLGIGLAFLILLVGYAIAGYFLFSDAVAGFRNGWPAIQTVVRALLGDFDYDDLRNSVTGAGAPIYYWSFLIVTISICLNFFVGILGGALDKVSDSEKEFTRGETTTAANLRSWMKKLKWETVIFLNASMLDELTQTVMSFWKSEEARINALTFATVADKDKMLTCLYDSKCAVQPAIDCTPECLDLLWRESIETLATPKVRMEDCDGNVVPCYNMSPEMVHHLHNLRQARYNAAEAESSAFFLTRAIRAFFSCPKEIELPLLIHLWRDGENEGSCGGAGFMNQFFAHLNTAPHQLEEKRLEMAKAVREALLEMSSELDLIQRKLEDVHAKNTP